MVTASAIPSAAGGRSAPRSVGGCAGRSAAATSPCDVDAKSERQLRIAAIARAGTPSTVAWAGSPGAEAVAPERNTGAASVCGASRR